MWRCSRKEVRGSGRVGGEIKAKEDAGLRLRQQAQDRPERLGAYTGLPVVARVMLL